MAFRKLNPVKLFKKITKHDGEGDGAKLAKKILATNAEKREDFIHDYVTKGEKPQLKLAKEALQNDLKTIQNNLKQTSFDIQKTLLHIYDFTNEQADQWVKIAKTKKLVTKLNELPKVKFDESTDPVDIKNFKADFMKRVKFYDELQHSILNINNALHHIAQHLPATAQQPSMELTI